MSLYHLTFKRKLTPEDLAETKHLKLFRDRLPQVTQVKLADIFDEEIAHQLPSKKSQLVWTKVGKLVGYSSQAPTVDTNYVWDKFFKAAHGSHRLAYQMLGTFAQWRISADDRDWLAYKQPTGWLNEEGREAEVTVYFISTSPHLAASASSCF